MVRGIEIFRQHFQEYTDQFVLIGGTACDLIMNEAGLPFRATKDLDIVLCIEVLDASFVNAFWEFVREGEYSIQQKESGEKQFYRFKDPGKPRFPYMLEIFSREPDVLQIPDGIHLTPIPMDEAVSSLSAILMDSAYYRFLHAGAKMLEGIPIVGPEHLIPLKAKAWLDLKERRKSDSTIGRRTVAKHKKDVFRLYRVLDPLIQLEIPEEIREDMSEFLEAMRGEDVDLKNLGIGHLSLEYILDELRTRYVNSS